MLYSLDEKWVNSIVPQWEMYKHHLLCYVAVWPSWRAEVKTGNHLTAVIEGIGGNWIRLTETLQTPVRGWGRQALTQTFSIVRTFFWFPLETKCSQNWLDFTEFLFWQNRIVQWNVVLSKCLQPAVPTCYVDRQTTSLSRSVKLVFSTNTMFPKEKKGGCPLSGYLSQSLHWACTQKIGLQFLALH